MEKLRITINGKTYEVEVERVRDGETVSEIPVGESVKQVAPKEPAHAPGKETPVSGGAAVEAPMPGSVFDVKAAVGDAVREGDVVIILEAMKMENEIMAPCAGRVLSIEMTKGSSVNTGDVLMRIG